MSFITGLKSKLSTPDARIFAVLSIVFLAIAAAIAYANPIVNTDWGGSYKPAALHVLRGESPYLVTDYFSPPIAAWFMIPLAIIPEPVGYVIYLWLLLCVSCYVCYRFSGGDKIAVATYMLSPIFLYLLLLGNVDWMIQLGYLLPAPLAITFIFVKPQIGIGIAAYWFFVSWRQGFVSLVKNFAPTVVLALLSFVIHGNWLIEFLEAGGVETYPRVWPWSLILVAILLHKWLKEQPTINEAALFSVALSPFVQFYSWTNALLGISNNRTRLILTTIVVWIITIVYLIGEYGT